MTKAKVLVALAMTGGVPNNNSVGNVTRVPPPATALIIPAAAPERINPTISAGVIGCVGRRPEPVTGRNPFWVVRKWKRSSQGSSWLATLGCVAQTLRRRLQPGELRNSPHDDESKPAFYLMLRGSLPMK